VEEQTWKYYYKNLSNEINRQVHEYIPNLKKAGVKIYNLSEEEKKIWVKATEPIKTQWAKKMDEKGLAGSTVVKIARTLEIAK
jgi:TRAP-type C4-dicarboxylate transport system substrate-binding protein